MKEKILEILNSYKEECKVGSDGDYENYEAIFTEDFNDLADALTDKQLQSLNNDHEIAVAYIGFRKEKIDHIDLRIREK